MKERPRPSRALALAKQIVGALDFAMENNYPAWGEYTVGV